MNHVVTDLATPNEPVMFINSLLGNYCVDTWFGDFQADSGSSVLELIFCTHQPALRDDDKREDKAMEIEFWTLHFDGYKTKCGVGIGCVLQDPKKYKTLIAFRLEFECTNNVAEYEALLQGLKKAIDLGVKNLKVFGDSEIIVKQVRNSIHCISNRLVLYQQQVWDILSCFEAFNIFSIPRYQNIDVDFLANVASRLIPSENFKLDAFWLKSFSSLQSQIISQIGGYSMMKSRLSIS